jgi:hypothetical protein
MCQPASGLDEPDLGEREMGMVEGGASDETKARHANCGHQAPSQAGSAVCHKSIYLALLIREY